MLAGFEAGTLELPDADMRPHAVVETWNVPRVPIGLRTIDTHISFATPTDVPSTLDSRNTAGLGSNMRIKTIPSGLSLNVGAECQD